MAKVIDDQAGAAGGVRSDFDGAPSAEEYELRGLSEQA